MSIVPWPNRETKQKQIEKKNIWKFFFGFLDLFSFFLSFKSLVSGKENVGEVQTSKIYWTWCPGDAYSARSKFCIKKFLNHSVSLWFKLISNFWMIQLLHNPISELSNFCTILHDLISARSYFQFLHNLIFAQSNFCNIHFLYDPFPALSNFCSIRTLCAKGQTISKCLFGVFNFLQKTHRTKSIWGLKVAK